VELRTSEGWLVILDAGTGIRELGRSLISRANGAPIAGDIFLTHAHWDHIQGIPFFGPIFQRGNHFRIWGAKALQTSIGRVVRDQMSPVVFPVAFEELDATIDFSEIAEECRQGNGYEVRAYQVRHPGGALGYRFSEQHDNHRALVYISDNELGPGAKYDEREKWREGLIDFVRDARVLIHDTMYTAEEYDHFRGWGHSTYDEAVELAMEAGVKQLVLYHHKPERGDDEVDRRVDECRAYVARCGSNVEIVAAAEGMTLLV